MATFNSATYYKGTVYRTPCQEDEMTIEFKVNFASGTTLTDGDFVNLFRLGEGHEIIEMLFQTDDELDTDGTPALTASCGWGTGSTEVFADTTTEFETDPVSFIAARDVSAGDKLIATTATTGASSRVVRLEVNTTAAGATDQAVVLTGYARVRRAAEDAPSLTYGWDGEEA